jgi:hypothetical protein
MASHGEKYYLLEIIALFGNLMITNQPPSQIWNIV